MLKSTIKYCLLVIVTFMVTNNTLTMNYDDLDTDRSYLFSGRYKAVYYTARALKEVHNVIGDFSGHDTDARINPYHRLNKDSWAFFLGECIRGSYHINFLTLMSVPLILNYVDGSTPFRGMSSVLTDWTGMFLCTISSYLTLRAGVGAAYCMSRDSVDLCSKIIKKDSRFFAESYSRQKPSREYNIVQKNELERFVRIHGLNSEKSKKIQKMLIHGLNSEKSKKIQKMLISKDYDLEPCKNTIFSYSQRLANDSQLKAANENKNHDSTKIIKFFGYDTVSSANEDQKSFSPEKCMICRCKMNDYKTLTDFSCNFHSIHQDCFNYMQEKYYKGKSDPDKRRCVVCT